VIYNEKSKKKKVKNPNNPFQVGVFHVFFVLFWVGFFLPTLGYFENYNLNSDHPEAEKITIHNPDPQH